MKDLCYKKLGKNMFDPTEFINKDFTNIFTKKI